MNDICLIYGSKLKQILVKSLKGEQSSIYLVNHKYLEEDRNNQPHLKLFYLTILQFYCLPLFPCTVHTCPVLLIHILETALGGRGLTLSCLSIPLPICIIKLALISFTAVN